MTTAISRARARAADDLELFTTNRAALSGAAKFAKETHMSDNLWRTWEELTDEELFGVLLSENQSPLMMAQGKIWRANQEGWECEYRSLLKASDIAACQPPSLDCEWWRHLALGELSALAKRLFDLATGDNASAALAKLARSAVVKQLESHDQRWPKDRALREGKSN